MTFGLGRRGTGFGSSCSAFECLLTLFASTAMEHPPPLTTTTTTTTPLFQLDVGTSNL